MQTITGTIHADVPLDRLNFDFYWQASRPRYLSDVELPPVQEKRGGVYSISGSIEGDESSKKKSKKPKKPKDPNETSVITADLISLNLRTDRGVILLNVDPNMVPSDLHERPLTDAAKASFAAAIGLIEAIRKVSPKLFGDYAKTLRPSKGADAGSRTSPAVRN